MDGAYSLTERPTYQRIPISVKPNHFRINLHFLLVGPARKQLLELLSNKNWKRGNLLFYTHCARWENTKDLIARRCFLLTSFVSVYCERQRTMQICENNPDWRGRSQQWGFYWTPFRFWKLGGFLLLWRQNAIQTDRFQFGEFCILHGFCESWLIFDLTLWNEITLWKLSFDSRRMKSVLHVSTMNTL